ncbi:trans-sulfuration enzyme family protein [Paraliomyxa miuraensis]|uniref:trans-sulfuration enzyme family protein n=1 Tax=Paraliomyxa miuraensis TaxID=376150 RepID=UPI00224F7268|nr:PLP-dependent aspartate aminotransferase family protein [Paraliomyxa miuraensis]MCX4244310.1 PLP-dependent aspartate aminotransferase family protein [Paraliomyxa miuraensis]
MSDHDDHQDTQLVHAGEPRPRFGGAVTMPVFQSSTFEHHAEGGYDDVRYLRLSNSPNHDALHRKLATIEGGEAALVTASGMAAVSAALLATLGPGDHVLAQRTLYGGTHDLFTGMLARWGVAHDFIDAAEPEAWEAALRPTTRAIYVEALTNPLLEVADLPAVARFARAHGLVSLIDATFATPVLLRPIALGFDLVLHSATKYLNGHSDLVAGAIIGGAARVEEIRHTLNLLGGSLDPHACFLLHRGLKTLGVRVRRQCASALAVATALHEHPAVQRVHYPGLPSHPGHERAKALLHGGFGAMLSFDLRAEPGHEVEVVRRFVSRLRLPVDAPSLGGPETLVTRPAVTSHAGLDPEVRRGLGIGDGLVRMSVGLEDPADLVADLQQALG